MTAPAAFLPTVTPFRLQFFSPATCTLKSPPASSQPSVTTPRWAPTWRKNNRPRPTPPDLELPGATFIDERPPLSLHDILEVVQGHTPDEYVDDITRCLLGYVEVENDNGEVTWDCSAVPEAWTLEYGTEKPPEFIGGGGGVREVDQVVKFAVRRLSKEIGKEYKQLLKAKLGPLGFKGWTIRDLNPNRTRRATTMNWALFYLAKRYGE